MPEAAHRHNITSNSIKSIIEIRIPIEGCNSRKILKWTEKSNADLMTSLVEESNTPNLKKSKTKKQKKIKKNQKKIKKKIKKSKKSKNLSF